MEKMILAGVLALAAVSASAADGLGNTSFEENNLGSVAQGYNYVANDLTADNWIFTGGTGVSRDATAWGGATATGDYFAFIQDYAVTPNTPAGANSVLQVFSLGSAADLSFSFDLAQRAFQVGSGIQSVSVSLDGKSLGDFTPFTTQGKNWASFTAAATGISAGLHLLSFTGNDTNVGDTSVFLDNVAMNVTAVPEPSSLAMLLAGLGMMGFIARRRTRA